MVYVYAILKACGISVECYHSKLSQQQRAAMVSRFSNQDQPMVFLTTVTLAGVGLTLQYRCHWVLMLDPAMSQGSFDQGLGRCLRVGQKETVNVVTLMAKGSFNGRQLNNNFRKAFPELLASMDKEVFDIERSVDEEGEVVLDLKDWVQYEGKLIPSGDARAGNLPVLKGVAVVKALSQNKLGIQFEWSSEETD
jgi:superfamily II helicase